MIPTSMTTLTKSLLLGMLLGVASASLPAEVPPCHLVADLNKTIHSYPDAVNNMVVIGSTIYMSGRTASEGKELWKSDGTANGTVMIKDIVPGSGSSDPQNLTNVNGVLFFTAMDNNYGVELWKSDGTAAGTVMVKDIRPGTSGSDIEDMVVAPDGVFFLADDGIHGKELWKSDGTPEGTHLVLDLNPGPNPLHVIYPLFGLNSVCYHGKLIFPGDDGIHGTELWISDGTTSGTRMLKEIKPGSAASTPSHLFVYKDKVFFNADDGINGYELWTTDGTPEGTQLFLDFNPGRDHYSNSEQFTIVGDTLYFLCWFDSTAPRICKSDGTPQGTVSVSKPDLPCPDRLISAGDQLFFLGTMSPYGEELWRSDGTAAGTTMVKDIYPGYGSSQIYHMTVLNNILYFEASSDLFSSNTELWRSDGTAAGTYKVKSAATPVDFTNPGYFTTCGSQIFFCATDGPSGYGLWKSDGTAAGSVRVKDFLPGNGDASFSYMAALKDTLFFRGGVGSTKLWMSDGSAAGTRQVCSYYLPSTESYGPYMAASGNYLYFAGNTGSSNDEVCRTDADGRNTTLIRHINTSAYVTSPQFLTDLNGKVIFQEEDGRVGGELYSSDGTYAGTGLVKDINPGSTGSSPSKILSTGNVAYFSASDGCGRELWRTDGTAAGTWRVMDINPGSKDALDISAPQLAWRNGLLYFQADDGVNGPEPWRSDGTTTGTWMLADVYPGKNGSGPKHFTAAGNRVYFAATDAAHGTELWSTDGTTTGTAMVCDINPSGSALSPNEYYGDGPVRTNIAGMNGMVYFSANDGIHGFELWKSDGTSSGTMTVMDINPGVADSSPNQMVAYDNHIFFIASTAATGNELWVTDGTTSGTRQVMDIWPGVESGAPDMLTFVKERLYFCAGDPVHGRELWALSAGGPRVGLTAEPTWTTGTLNTISWPANDWATSCTLEYSDSPTWDHILGAVAVPTTAGQTTITGLSNGITYYYRLRGSNFLGMDGPCAVTSSTQDAGLPQSQITTPSGSNIYTKITLTWSATDPGSAASGIKNVQLFGNYQGGKPVLLGTFPPQVGSTQVDLRRLGGGLGSYNFYTIATDQAGNVEMNSGKSTKITVSYFNGIAGWERFQ